MSRLPVLSGLKRRRGGWARLRQAQAQPERGWGGVEADNRLGFGAIALKMRYLFGRFSASPPLSRRPVLDTGLGFSRTFPFGKMPE